MNPDKLAALGLAMHYDHFGDPDRDTLEKNAEQHIIRIRPFVGDVSEDLGEFDRVLAEIKFRLNG